MVRRIFILDDLSVPNFVPRVRSHETLTLITTGKLTICSPGVTSYILKPEEVGQFIDDIRSQFPIDLIITDLRHESQEPED